MRLEILDVLKKQDRRSLSIYDLHYREEEIALLRIFKSVLAT